MGLGRGVWDGGDAAMGGKLNEKQKLGQDRLGRRTLKNPIAPEHSGLPRQAEMPGPTLPKYNCERPAFPTSRELPRPRHDLGLRRRSASVSV
jgi:hypothetical protein